MNTEIETEAPEIEKINLSIDVKEKSACERHVTVTVPRDDIERYYQKQFDMLVPKAEVPGFRIGRAPRNLVEKKFRKQVADQVKGSLLMDSLTQISDSDEFSAISEPDLDFEQVKIPEEGDLTYEFNIEVRPEFEIPEWKGLKLERPEHEFTDADVEAEMNLVSERFSALVPVEEAVELNDQITCNITSRLDGKVLSKAEEVNIKVAESLLMADATVEDFGKLVVGAKADEKKTTKVKISEFADNMELANKEIEIEFEILDVKRVEKKSAEELGKTLQMEGDELTKMIREGLVSRLEYAQRKSVRDQISKLLTESADWDLPPDLLRRQSGRELERAVIELRSSGFSDEEIRERENRLRHNILDQTKTLLKEHFILERIAEAEDVQETDADFDVECERIAAQQNTSARSVRAMLERNGQIDSLRNMIVERKVIELITEEATFKATKYENENQQKSSAIDFHSGGAVSQIPEAKHADNSVPGEQPVISVERD